MLFIALGYLLLKHAIADFFLQGPYQWRNKGTYGHPGGLLHCAIHLVLTMPVFLLLPAGSVGYAALILVAEFVFHYHVDWSKEQVIRRLSLTTSNDGYWRAMGIDQLMHGLTYVVIVMALTSRG
ncbi:MAG: DUF3307 domain-containing protein [Hyphomicrobiaceae bacterium]|nr:DUF3307 domain-containing protein [Hyphomicrobiaceae bacterium]